MQSPGSLSAWRVTVLVAIVLPVRPLPAADESKPDAIAGAIGIDERGALLLPATARGADGRDLPIEGLSGISWMGGDRYVAVMDNSRTVLEFRLRLSEEGRPVEASAFLPSTVAEHHDYEDVVWLPAAARGNDGSAGQPSSRGRVLLCEEDSPAVHAFDLATGERVATLGVPEIFRTRRENRGFESLAIDAGGEHAWTANEEPLAVDGPAVSADAAGVVRLLRLPLVAGRGVPQSCRQHAYPLDPPHRFLKLRDGAIFSGVTAIVPLGPERLLVLERSGGAGLPPFESRIYEVRLAGAEDVSGVRERLSEAAAARLAKRLVWKGQIGVNLEGLCLGPRLGAGVRSLVGVGDNGGLGTPSRLVVFGLTFDQPRP